MALDSGPEAAGARLAGARQRIALTGGIQNITNVTFILATGWNGSSPFPPFQKKAKAKGWKTRTLPCGHDAMLDLPEELTKVLLDELGI